MRNSKIQKNVFFGFISQILVLAIGIIIPRIMISSYGSDTNGLLSTITQVFMYIGLLQSGIGQATRNALFHAITNKSKDEIEDILSTTRSYFRRICVVYYIAVVVMACVLPLIIKSGVDKRIIAAMLLIEGSCGVVSFLFIETKALMITSDGKGYVATAFDTLCKLLIYVVKIVMALNGVGIIFLSIFTVCVTFVRMILYNIYFKKSYSWIKIGFADKSKKLVDRLAYVVTEIAGTVFSSTDMIVLSVFISTEISSVYAVYSLVFTSVSGLLYAVYANVCYILGQSYHKSISEYEKIHDTFVSVFMGLITVMISVAYVVCLPFVKLYVKDTDGVQYIYKELPLLFSIITLLSWSRYIPGNLTGVSGHAKSTSRVSIIEATINLVLSIVLVRFGGFSGVLLATIIAIPIKIIWCIYISDILVMRRKVTKSIMLLLVNYLFFAVVVILSRYINIDIGTYWQLILYVLALLIVFLLANVAINISVNPGCVKVLYKLIFRNQE